MVRLQVDIECVKIYNRLYSTRLTLDKSVDLDVGPEDRLCSKYKATLGHKACHSFQMRNAAFQEFEHPR